MESVSSLTINATIAGFRAVGVDPTPWMSVRRPPSGGLSVDEPFTSVPGDTLARLWNKVLTETGDATLPSQAGHAVPEHVYDLLDHIAYTANTVEHAVPILNRYSDIASEAMSLYLTRDRGDWIWFSFNAPQPYRAIVEQWCLAVIKTRFAHNGGFAVDEVHLSQPDNGEADHFAEHWGVPVRLGRPRTGMRLVPGVCTARNVGANPPLFTTLCRLADDLELRRLDYSSIVSEVRRCLKAAFDRRRYAIDDVADAIGTSTRSLQRALAERRVTFKELLDIHRREYAFQMIRDGARNIATIAHELDYTDQSSFSRAFRRWTGCCPREWASRMVDANAEIPGLPSGVGVSDAVRERT